MAVADAYPVATTSANTWQVDGSAAAGGSATNGDLGYCCYKAADFITEAKKTQATATFDTTKFNKWTCPAKFTGNYATGATYAAGTADTHMTHSTNNWWCSDGTYNLTDSDAYGTGGATAHWNLKDSSEFAAAAENTLVLAADPTTVDKRLDLFLAACRQKRTICGNGHVEEGGTDASR